MSKKQIRSPEIDALLTRVVREINKLPPLEAVALISAMMRLLAERLHDMGVEVELSTKTTRN